ncbi:Hypothetical Protein RRSL_02058 [Ralstonia solanacearum UW551]|uniref:Uncharacterized protein n=1 Tax=Ralstonia solanacearum (strain UW551) TaxID=342110 RepID=A0AB33VDA0_RALSU|nr:Hypothetical Protein RRSL_02058 [Ralstonia solanacearum UW551]PNQ30187.1 hypothetical protein CVS51_19620 [Ralstonia solanacearum]PNQ35129.1 hypothetical protein CVV71_17230 [Ralstonia solanacearum]PNQ38195.1 hypothetical protein CVT22_20850 [Ralstonia solanacearum]PNQ38467.1 hypothetical protein CVT21_18375 [Ralstonia solanacearum]
MERPGLKRLLADIERGLIEIVVVYKIEPGGLLQDGGGLRERIQKDSCKGCGVLRANASRCRKR